MPPPRAVYNFGASPTVPLFSLRTAPCTTIRTGSFSEEQSIVPIHSGDSQSSSICIKVPPCGPWQMESVVNTAYENMASALIAGMGVAGVAFAARVGIRLARRYNLAAKMPDMSVEGIKKTLSQTAARKTFYEGGFQQQMNRREAALILSVKESANKKEVMLAHRRLMQLNHPDKGGNAYISAKINEAKDHLISGKA